MSGNSWPVKVARQGSGNYSGELSEEQRLQAAGILPMRRSESNNSLPRYRALLKTSLLEQTVGFLMRASARS